MRWLTKAKPEAERGAAGVLVAVIMLVLIGAGALAVDVGQIYVERAQLQNGADSGAMAVMQACHETGCTQDEAEAIAEDLADSNSNDGSSTVFEVDMTVDDEVTVRTTTRDGTSGAGFLRQMFSSALGAPPATVGAHATAGLEFPSGGSAFPLAISDCQYDLSGAEASGEVQLIKYKPGMSSCTSTAGHVIPGGFGWLEQTDTACHAATDIDDNADSDTGADYPKTVACDAILQSWKDTINSGGSVMGTFPVYDNAGGTGAGGWFHIRGYATFDLQGWKFGGGTSEPRTFHNKAPDVADPADSCVDPCRGIIGQFVKFTSIDSGGGLPGVGVNLGTVKIRLIN